MPDKIDIVRAEQTDANVEGRDIPILRLNPTCLVVRESGEIHFELTMTRIHRCRSFGFVRPVGG
jgi:hypothetical protein